MHIFHKWSKWQIVKVNIIWYNGTTREQGIREKQERVCAICGLVERKEL